MPYEITYPVHDGMKFCPECGLDRPISDFKKSGRISRRTGEDLYSTGMTRSLLCDFCNRGLGIFRDSPDLLIAAAAYLLQHNGGDD